ncbi:MAG: short-chain alcohol dehydrogenase [Microgenomates group bacterium Gr01-1014_5]|nr:MAG: short-chain alcohol dehydrogenase [Microgenomates group bacterium Gr01-1014_5]
MLKGKTAIITGGSRGIGFAIAKELSSQGANVVICSRNQEELNKAVEKLSVKYNKVFGQVADVSCFNDCEKLVNLALSKTGRIDILVNNAGIYGPVGLLETNDPEAWLNVLSINVLGAVYCSKLVIPHMKKQGAGKIINLAGAGVGGTKPLPRFSGYYTSKAAIASLTENLASELQTENIQVNAIAPGGVASDLNLNLLKLDKSIVGEEMYQTAKTLKEQGGTPPELAAKLVAFLVSKGADHITGRLLSAKWDPIKELQKSDAFTQNLYRLRRIDNRSFFEK